MKTQIFYLHKSEKDPFQVTTPRTNKKAIETLKLASCAFNRLMVCQHPEGFGQKCASITCPVLIALSEHEYDPAQVFNQ